METELYRKIGFRIKSARDNLGVSQEELASTLGYKSPATISHFESGLRKISIADLQKIADELGKSIDYFLDLSEPKEEMQRFILRASEQIWSSAQYEIAEFLSYVHNQNQSYAPTLRLENIDDPDEVVKYLLRKLNIFSPPIAPDEIAIELGITVYYWKFPNEVSGILVSEGESYKIGINQSHPNVRQRFSIAHELGHFIYQRDRDLFMDFTDNEMSLLGHNEKDRTNEIQANQFAASLLMPKAWVEKDFKKFGEIGLHLLAQRYIVSEQAMWFRLKNLKLVRD
ncbi:ImmA/IrrE family metallo-endopeptidase [bacterium]|nr:ImmA/IrrE family metallo-endopeptidase [bacterium]MCB2179332.1 ImmA/IrrE family metallo-endopeptidase [bacterium]